jgi:hypothetical protein
VAGTVAQANDASSLLLLSLKEAVVVGQLVFGFRRRLELSCSCPAFGGNNKPTEQPEKVRRDEPPNFVLLPFFVVFLLLSVSLSLDLLLLAVS